MNRLIEFWRKVRELESELDAAGTHTYLTSVEILGGSPGHKSGVVVEVSNYSGAEHIVRGSHRLATPEEVAEFKADQERRRLEIKRAQMSRGENGERRIFVGLPIE